ncbi:stage III sporulation protein AF [Clostridium cylindrosporum]|uniref:Stage III sporulation protein AF n=1 Tax=Clostridium cylindrosporum DSM 605 TaxID=1121307 RepID=A0A0J8DAJ5_CLOCY|nr:stage III sporulation protein AF [Clostridium cylindrosporum]KMT21344.1 stage III sporulation protein AF [Clostridium cylindrosporum DSM 605]
MMDALKGWITSVVATVIIITIVELILPEGNIKKYVKLATGLLVMVAVLSPLFKILVGDFSLNEKISSYSEAISSYSKVDTKKAHEEFKTKTREAFKTSLKENISKEIKSKTGKDYIVTSIELKNDKNELDFKGIKWVEVKKSSQGEVVTVNKVQIGDDSKPKDEVPREKDVLKVLEDSFNVKGAEVKFIR